LDIRMFDSLNVWLTGQVLAPFLRPCQVQNFKPFADILATVLFELPSDDFKTFQVTIKDDCPSSL
jgi:hypothetical protein